MIILLPYWIFQKIQTANTSTGMKIKNHPTSTELREFFFIYLRTADNVGTGPDTSDNDANSIESFSLTSWKTNDIFAYKASPIVTWSKEKASKAKMDNINGW